MAEYESLAEFTLTLKDEDEIFCYCTRVTIDDRDLLYFGERTEVESNPDPTYSSDFLRVPSHYPFQIQISVWKEAF